ncbi:LuxR family quorum sensing-dependent transcriptional regulator [Neorhizobium sp. 2083]|uniref:LuxR family transcriptional regulator n=1 Tax=Neorhizobium sp. 2083 TaxID=2817762 RepID=UPI0028627F6F|nr:LuxR family transcriptional regulator [Neorhizobium sp. 2083]MDR6819949.1 LuxR family quorum sensing-dependent transcriptional regulator [Neorhizobium sp. 2083]
MLDGSRYFYNNLDALESIESISKFLLDHLRPVGVNGLFIARLPVNRESISSNIILDSWNPNWTKEYARGEYVQRDPVAQHLLQTRDPFVWSEICAEKGLTVDERRIMEGARDSGLIDGLTVPIHGPSDIICISYSTSGGRLERFDRERMRFIGILALSKIRQISPGTGTGVSKVGPKGLSAQEIKCLQLAWRGFSSKQIAQQTGLTHRTVDQYLARVMNKLHAHNRVDAARLAIEYGFMRIH